MRKCEKISYIKLRMTLFSKYNPSCNLQQFVKNSPSTFLSFNIDLYIYYIYVPHLKWLVYDESSVLSKAQVVEELSHTLFKCLWLIALTKLQIIECTTWVHSWHHQNRKQSTPS